MKKSRIIAFFFLFFIGASSAFAQGAGSALPQPSFGELLGRMAPMFLMVFFIFYFLVMRPQQQKEREHGKLIESLKKGDMVVTSSGMIARVAGKEKDHILLEVANGMRVKFEPSAILKHYEKSPAPVKKAA